MFVWCGVVDRVVERVGFVFEVGWGVVHVFDDLLVHVDLVDQRFFGLFLVCVVVDRGCVDEYEPCFVCCGVGDVWDVDVDRGCVGWVVVEVDVVEFGFGVGGKVD